MIREEELANWVAWIRANYQAYQAGEAEYLEALLRNVGGLIKWHEENA